MDTCIWYKGPIRMKKLLVNTSVGNGQIFPMVTSCLEWTGPQWACVWLISSCHGALRIDKAVVWYGRTVETKVGPSEPVAGPFFRVPELVIGGKAQTPSVAMSAFVYSTAGCTTSSSVVHLGKLDQSAHVKMLLWGLKLGARKRMSWWDYWMKGPYKKWIQNF